MDEGGGQVWCIGTFTLFTFIVKRSALKNVRVCCKTPNEAGGGELRNGVVANGSKVQRCKPHTATGSAKREKNQYRRCRCRGCLYDSSLQSPSGAFS